MVKSAANSSTARSADRQWRRPFAAAAITKLGQLVRNLVERRIHVIGELNFRHRPQAVDSHPDGNGDDAPFGQRRIEYALRAEPCLQALCRPEYAAEVAHILAKHAHVRI